MQDNTNLLLVGGLIIAAGVVIIAKFLSNKKKDDEPIKPATPKVKQQEIHGNSSKVVATTPTPQIMEGNLDKITPAKDAFIKNISMFAPLLPTLRDNMNTQEWKESIVATQNMQLIQYWKQFQGKSEAWETILQTWGIKCEECSSFTAIQPYKGMYRLEDGTDIVIGNKYHVKQPCWVLTTYNDNDKAVKRVVSVGIVTKM